MLSSCLCCRSQQGRHGDHLLQQGHWQDHVSNWSLGGADICAQQGLAYLPTVLAGIVVRGQVRGPRMEGKSFVIQTLQRLDAAPVGVVLQCGLLD